MPDFIDLVGLVLTFLLGMVAGGAVWGGLLSMEAKRSKADSQKSPGAQTPADCAAWNRRRLPDRYDGTVLMEHYAAANREEREAYLRGLLEEPFELQELSRLLLERGLGVLAHDFYALFPAAPMDPGLAWHLIRQGLDGSDPVLRSAVAAFTAGPLFEKERSYARKSWYGELLAVKAWAEILPLVPELEPLCLDELLQQRRFRLFSAWMTASPNQAPYAEALERAGLSMHELLAGIGA